MSIEALPAVVIAGMGGFYVAMALLIRFIGWRIQQRHDDISRLGDKDEIYR